MQILNIRLDEETTRKIDNLVAKGLFKTRSQALRKLVQNHLAEHPEFFWERELEDSFKEDILEGELREICAVLFSGMQTAAEMVKEGRGG